MKPALSAAIALVLSTTLVAQTAIKPPKNRYKPEDDVKLGREAAAEVRKQYPVIENGQITDLPLTPGPRARGPGAARAEQARVRVLVHGGQSQGNQRVRPAGRTDVRQPRHGGRGDDRGPGRRRDGARARARAAAARHGERDQGAERAVRRARRRHRRRGDRRTRRHRGSAGQPVRPRHAAAQVQPRVREAGRPPRCADDGAGRLRPQRSRTHVRDDREAEQGQRRARVAERSPEPGQPLAVHRR